MQMSSAPDCEDVLRVAIDTSCKFIISDTTAAPFFFSELHLSKFDGIFIQLQSLAKYAQLGTNIAMGGLAIIYSSLLRKILGKLRAKRMK
ncbi:MAG: hypothetical protein DWQ07_23710 [Chloroflexi bacterium]|nr:MAG: hypothetical protein DWQ07_23710 [Chloroflexota bacterium]MBL1194156.1 hypothetical protein [Chloroflexota bacterium]